MRKLPYVKKKKKKNRVKEEIILFKPKREMFKLFDQSKIKRLMILKNLI